MSTLSITSKGQVTLRKEILKHLGANPGDKITVDMLADGRIEMRVARADRSISASFNWLKREDGRSLSIDALNEIAAEGWAGKT